MNLFLCVLCHKQTFCHVYLTFMRNVQLLTLNEIIHVWYILFRLFADRNMIWGKKETLFCTKVEPCGMLVLLLILYLKSNLMN